MTAKIIIVEGNSPEVLANIRQIDARPAAEIYKAVLTALAPDIETITVMPSAEGFNPDAIDLEGITGAVLTGSGVAWSADDARAAMHRQLFERFMQAGIPTAGSCWGMQIAAVVLGGTVRSNPKGREIGVARAIQLTKAGREHKIYTGKPSVFDSICIHRDEVASLPTQASLLAYNDHSEIQAFAFEQGNQNFIGWQYHPELSLAEIADYLATPGRNVLNTGSEFASQQALESCIADFQAIAAKPEATPALRWRYGITDHAALFQHRSLELSNWLTYCQGK